MTRGKYAARAANRLAELDNDLLRDKCAEVDELKAVITVRHESGAITIPLGATTGEPLRREPIPVFPVVTRRIL